MGNWVDRLAGYAQVYVAGAGKRARELVRFEKYGILPFCIDGFLVSSSEGNPEELEGIPVYGIFEYAARKQDIAVVVSLSYGNVWNELVQNLIAGGFENIFPIPGAERSRWVRESCIRDLEEIDREGVQVHRRFGEKNAVYLEYPQEGGTSRMMRIYEDRIWHLKERRGEIPEGWSLLREFESIYGSMNMLADAMKEVRGRNGRESGKRHGGAEGDDRESSKRHGGAEGDGGSSPGLKCRVYMSMSHLDSAISEDLPAPWLVPIQAGAALTDRKICELRDDSGEDTISRLNADFCECTALYWCWKNDRESNYIGLCHYRRRIAVPDHDMEAVMATGADLILTTPLYTSMVLRENFAFMLLPGDWEVVGRSLKERFPAYLPTWERLQGVRCYPACNIGIFRRAVFEDYCGFAFAVMKDVYDYYRGKNVVRENRYAGFLMELLLALYALHNKDRYKIYYTDFDFLR